MFIPSEVLLKKNLNTALQNAEAWKTLVSRVDKLEKDLPTQIAEDFALKTEIEKDFLKKSDAETTYLKVEDAGTGYVKKEDADGEDGYIKKKDVALTYATRSELTQKEEALNLAISGKQAAGNYVTDEELESKVKKLNLADKCETPEAAQAKATGALNDAKKYADKKITDLVGGAGEAYDTLKEIEELLKKGDDVHAAINNMLAKKTNKFAQDLGDGAAKEFTVQHNLKTEDVTITMRDNGTKDVVLTDVKIVDENNVKVIFDQDETAPTQNQIRIVIVG